MITAYELLRIVVRDPEAAVERANRRHDRYFLPDPEGPVTLDHLAMRVIMDAHRQGRPVIYRGSAARYADAPVRRIEPCDCETCYRRQAMITIREGSGWQLLVHVGGEHLLTTELD